jgi:hypothetical protein
MPDTKTIMSGDTQRVPRPKVRWSWSAFVGMLGAGSLATLVIVTIMAAGSWRERGRRTFERKALVHFFAVEAAELYGDACERAHAFVLHRKQRRALSIRMANAQLIERAVALADDVTLAGRLRGFYGAHARFSGLLELTYDNFAASRTAGTKELGALVDECAVMQDEVGEIIRIARREELDVNVLTQLEASMGKPAEMLEDMKRSAASRNPSGAGAD